MEKDLVQTETLTRGGSDFRTHFVGVGQLFIDRTWGFGGSQFGPNDTISFQVGWPLWWFVILAIPLLIINIKDYKKSIIGIFFLLMFLLSVFMQHNKSAFIWEAISNLQFAQFPWRFLSLSIFSASILTGFVLSHFSKHKFLVVWLIVFITIFLNWSFFQPREFYTWINDKNKLEDPLWEIQQKAGVMDYLPRTATEPQGRAPNNIEVISGNAQGFNYQSRSNSFSVNVNAAEASYIQIPVFDFPNWTVFINGSEFKHDNKEELGRIGLKLSPGNYEIKGIFKNTLVRTIANIITLISFGLIIVILFKKKLLQKII